MTDAGPVDVVVPVDGAHDFFLRCLASLAATRTSRATGWSSCSTGPARRRRGPRPPEAGPGSSWRTSGGGGFVVSANRGMAASDRDVDPAQQRHRGDRGLGRQARAAAYSGTGRSPPSRRSRTTPRSARCRARSEDNALPAGCDVDAFGRARRGAFPARLPAPAHRRRRLPLHQAERARRGRALRRGALRRGLRRGERLLHARAPGRLRPRAGRRHVHLPRGPAELRRGAVRARGAPRMRALRRLHPEYLATVAAFIREDRSVPCASVEACVRQRPPRPEITGRMLHLVHGWPPWSSAGTELYAPGSSGGRPATARSRSTRASPIPSGPQGEAIELLDHGARVRLIVNNFTQRDPLSRNALRDRGPGGGLRAPAGRGPAPAPSRPPSGGTCGLAGGAGGAEKDPDSLPAPGLVAALRPREPARRLADAVSGPGSWTLLALPALTGYRAGRAVEPPALPTP